MGTLRHIAALAPLSGGINPRFPEVTLRIIGPKESVPGQHPLFLVEPVPDLSSRGKAPFALEDAPELSSSELLDLVEIEINGCDADIVALKEQTFSRERQAGVTGVEDALDELGTRMEGLGQLEESLANQRSWLLERT